ncbi:GNAT family N-acetyltransferase [Naasia sp. SYSU D00057]|uniref:GNAT family N-acetyltransferase n=1 Tax=Naasia sp. SYSU D00057 TaxID=2817380 RepID=UPI001B312EA1|nr:GNAT family protein [Naasia sp. SYSU D00057]
MSFPFFDMGDGYDLVLRDLHTVDALHDRIRRNRPRLRLIEPWAAEETSLDADRAHTRAQLEEWMEGRALPLAIRYLEVPIGAVGLRIDREMGTATLAYWVDAAVEGRGAVTRAVSAVVAYGFSTLELARIEIRTSASNERARAVAERAGFTLEGVLRSAAVVGDERQDVAVYGRLAGAAVAEEAPPEGD